MRTSQFFFTTLKEAPNDAELPSHRLMLRAGLIKRLAAGIYTWMPLGLRVLRKVEATVREEMNRAGAIELLMPAVQPGELWQKSGRWEKYGPELLRLKDRHHREFVIGPTHEEVITDTVKRDVKSYRQLPIHLYQIQTKFRDEIRPRFGVMRGREFLMKDGYSFHSSFSDLQREYQNMYDTYTRIFTRLGLEFRAVAADTGSIGGSGSHEFHVLADSGEDTLAYCKTSDYAANVELAAATPPIRERAQPSKPAQKTNTPGKTRCEDVAAFLGIDLESTVKAVALIANQEFCLLLLRGDHSLNEIKVAKLPGMDAFRFATESEIIERLGCKPGYIGPVPKGGPHAEIPGVRVIADHTANLMSDFVCGANEENAHITGVNWGRDLPEPSLVADIRNVIEGDVAPDGTGVLSLCKGIEVGHIFQLRTKYSEAMECTFLDENGKENPMEMGCYGIGVTRVIGAAIEQNHDDRGIIFPQRIAPFELSLIPVAFHKSETVREAVMKLYADFKAAGVDLLLDDRDERPGVLFADNDLIGVPHRIVVGERGLKEGKIEYKGRSDTEAVMVPIEDVVAYLKEKGCGDNAY